MKRMLRVLILVVITAAFLAVSALPVMAKANFINQGSHTHVNKNGQHSNTHCSAAGEFQCGGGTTTVTITETF